MQTTLIIGREDLLSDSREKPFGEIQGGDLPWNYEQTVAEVIWFEDGGKRIRIKDRENALDGVVIDSSTNAGGDLPPPSIPESKKDAPGG